MGGRHFKSYQDICENVIAFDYSIGLDLYSKGKELKKIVQEINPDIIHSWFTQTTLYTRLFLRKFKQPKIFQVVGPAHLEILIFKWGDILSAAKNDYWVATSQYIYNQYKNANVSEDKLFLNYAFIDTETFLHLSSTVQQRDLRKEFGIADHMKIIGTASYIYPPKFFQKMGIKGHEVLLEAFKILYEKRDDVVLFISGTTFGKDVRYETQLREKAAEISPNRIFFTGGYKNVNEVMSNFQVFVYLSASENLGGVYESLLLEIPTVSSDRGALPELVINDKTGYNVDLENPQKIADRIELMLIDGKKFGKQGKAMVEETFDKEEIIEKAFQIYKSVLNTNALDR